MSERGESRTSPRENLTVNHRPITPRRHKKSQPPIQKAVVVYTNTGSSKKRLRKVPRDISASIDFSPKTANSVNSKARSGFILPKIAL